MAAFDNIFEFLSLGGPVVLVLIGLSIFALTLIIVKATQFFGAKIGSTKNIDAALINWFKGDCDTALDSLRNGKSAASRATYEAMSLKDSGGATREEIENSVTLISKVEFHRLQRGFKTLDAIVQVAPLLGLFGTVIGMIEAFQTLQGAGRAVDPAQLAGGIWVALLTTAVGLAIAIPVSLFVTWLETRVESERVAIEVATESIIAAPRPVRKFVDVSDEDQDAPEPQEEDEEENSAT